MTPEKGHAPHISRPGEARKNPLKWREKGFASANESPDGKGVEKNRTAASGRASIVMDETFWITKNLEEMNKAEWEALCDGCAACCLIQLEDEDTGERVFTRLACKLLDVGACRCTDYENRHARVPSCARVTLELLKTADWLPPTCAYRLLYEGKDLYWWHPLVSGDPETVHQAGISVRSFARNERAESVEEIEEKYLAPNLFAKFRKA